jgi:catechol 2,3-dioxygenase
MVNKKLGEIVIRTPNLETMINFYQKIIGLTVFKKFQFSIFLKIADDFEGHPQILALFDENIPSNGPGEPKFTDHKVSHSPIHHLAFAMTINEFESEFQRIKSLGYELRIAEYDVMGWRSFYIYDPDGNTIEFVCYDKHITEINK